MRKISFVLALASSFLFGADGPPASPQRAVYHIRALRITASQATPGAALGAGTDTGRALLPQAEIWGTPDQVRTAVRELGGEHAELLTGLVIAADPEGRLQTERKLYVGGRALMLTLVVDHTDTERAASDMRVALRSGTETVPLLETELSVTHGRTAAIAVPLEPDREWLVIAVTPLPFGKTNGEIKSQQAFVLTEGITPPPLEQSVDPRFPSSARERNMTDGRVILQVIIDEQGVVRSPVVLRVPVDGEDLVFEAIEAVMQWRYRPALKDGKPVPVYITLMVNFKAKSVPDEP